MIFTGTDKALLDRAARLLDGEAKGLHWDLLTNLKARRTAKLEFDRLTRDARDLRALGKRIAAVAVKATPPLEKRLQLEKGLQDGTGEHPTIGGPNGQQEQQPAG